MYLCSFLKINSAKVNIREMDLDYILPILFQISMNFFSIILIGLFNFLVGLVWYSWLFIVTPEYYRVYESIFLRNLMMWAAMYVAGCVLFGY